MSEKLERGAINADSYFAACLGEQTFFGDSLCVFLLALLLWHKDSPLLSLTASKDRWIQSRNFSWPRFNVWMEKLFAVLSIWNHSLPLDGLSIACQWTKNLSCDRLEELATVIYELANPFSLLSFGSSLAVYDLCDSSQIPLET